MVVAIGEFEYCLHLFDQVYNNGRYYLRPHEDNKEKYAAWLREAQIAPPERG